MEPAVGLGPINELKEFLRVVRFAILVIDVESVFVSIDDHERNRHPERPVRVFVADEIVQPAVDRMHHQHRPTRGGLCASEEIVRPFLDRTEPFLNRTADGGRRVVGLERQAVEIKLVENHAVATA